MSQGSVNTGACRSPGMEVRPTDVLLGPECKARLGGGPREARSLLPTIREDPERGLDVPLGPGAYPLLFLRSLQFGPIQSLV